jgi:hypothetical protein
MRNLITCLSVCVLSAATFADQPPILNENFKLTPSDAADDGKVGGRFGTGVATSSDGTTVIAGASLDNDNGSYSGSAYIFTLVSGIWEETKLLASDGETNDNLGYSVAISGDGNTAVVNSSWSNDDGKNSGSVYIYEFDGSNWLETKLTASDGTSQDQFGHSIAISADGTTVIVGSPGDDDNGNNSGSVYIYTLANGAWIETQKLTASDGASEDLFGYLNVALSGDGSTAIVSARRDDDNGNESGSVYIYSLLNGAWSETAKLIASDGHEGDYFGEGVSLSSDGLTAIVGAPFNDDQGSDSGSAYIFRFDGTDWNEEVKLTASDGLGNEYFGLTVSVSGDGTSAVIGSRGHNQFSGSAYIYKFVDGNLWEETKLLASDGAAEDSFGYRVALSGDGSTAIVGAYGDDYNNNTNAGSAYIFDLVGWSTCIGDIALDDNQVNIHDLTILIALWGTDSAVADINQDGIVNVSDLLIVVSSWGACE